MEALYRFISGILAGLMAFFAPIGPLVVATTIAISIDFCSGVAADYAASKRANRPWYFESHQAWHTIVKLTWVITAIVMAWLIDTCMIPIISLHLSQLVAGFTCGVEFWSFLENASEFSDAPFFRKMRRFLRRRIQQQM